MASYSYLLDTINLVTALYRLAKMSFGQRSRNSYLLELQRAPTFQLLLREWSQGVCVCACVGDPAVALAGGAVWGPHGGLAGPWQRGCGATACRPGFSLRCGYRWSL